MSTNLHEQYYRNGQVQEAVSLRQGQRHGVVRTWHRNGVLASEERYRHGILHGWCRQWTETGRLLGEYRMNRGTGLQREWHDNGKRKLEVSTVGGVFCGRSRIWLRDGTLLSERFYLDGSQVTVEEYRSAAKANLTLPRFRGRAGKPLQPGLERERRIHRVFIQGLLSKPNQVEARKWFGRADKDRGRRLLGRFEHELRALRFIEALYQAGAVDVIIPDVHADKSGNQFSDGLIVRLPRSPLRRRAVRRACGMLRRQKLGSVQPERELGESHLYLSMS